MKKVIFLLVLGAVLSGCASGSLPPTEFLIRKTKEDVGGTKIFNYAYKDVFYASEDALLNCSSHPYLVKDSDFEKGYILASRRGDPVLCGSVMVLVERINENNTRVIMRGFRDIRWKAFYNQFFKRVEMNLSRSPKLSTKVSPE